MALPARVISTMSRSRTRMPPVRSNHRCRRAKAIIDDAWVMQAHSSHPHAGFPIVSSAWRMSWRRP